MLPSRERALKGLDYEPRDYKEIQAEQDVQNAIAKSSVKAKMWGMGDHGNYTKVRVFYRGEQIDLVVSPDAPADDPKTLAEVAERFFTFYDIGKTRVLGKAQTTDTLTTREPSKAAPPKGGKKGGVHGKSVVELSDKLGKTDTIPVYKDNVLAIFKHVRNMDMFTTDDAVDALSGKYKSLSPATTRNKAGAHLRFMVDQGWLKSLSKNPTMASMFRVIRNPFESEMPAQAEFSTEDERQRMAGDLNAQRRNEDGPKC